MKKLLVIAFVLAGCGNEAAAPKTATNAAEPTAKAAPPDLDCGAGLIQKTPAGWVPAGKLVVTLAGEEPKHLEAEDAAGKTTMSTDLTGDNKAAKDAMSKAICSAGALAAISPHGKPTGAVTLDLIKPSNTDPANDVKAMCTPPADMPADLDTFQVMRVAIAGYDESLVSTKWRKWLKDMTSELGKASDDNAKIAIKAKHAGELDAASSTKPCWFAEALRGKVGSK